MGRMARVKIEQGEAYYHLYSHTACYNNELPLDNKLCRKKIIDTIHFLSQIYCCQVLGFCVMGNHYHLLVHMEEHKEISKSELKERAYRLYYKDTRIVDEWHEQQWKRFEERIHDVSELMRSLQSAVARWYNNTYARRGRFWAERFKSTLLESMKEMLDCLLYVDLNSVRAGITDRPEDYEGSSIYYRSIGHDEWLFPLTRIMGIDNRMESYSNYKARLYYRGHVASRSGQYQIPEEVIKSEELLGFGERGIYLKRLRHFVDGVVLGSADYVRSHLDHLKESKRYKRRKNPICQLGGIHLSLREQRGYG